MEPEKRKIIVFFLLLLVCGPLLFAQEDRKKQREAGKFQEEAQQALEENDFASAEVAYRKAIARDPEDQTAHYNMGNMYYSHELPSQAERRYRQAAEIAEDKKERHRAFHNLGNSLMRQEKYDQTIEAYKEALRNDPKDEETRYNLALAKRKQEEDQQEDGGDDQEDQDQDQDQEKQEDQDQGDQDQDAQDDQDGEQDQEPQDDGEKEDQEQEDPQDGQGDQEEQPQQPQQGQLSPQQIQSLLDAMNNEERKVQDKINAEKAKGSKVRSEKDW